MMETIKNLPGWLITGVLGAVSVAYVFLVFLPTQRSISETNRNIEAKQAEILAASKSEIEIQQVSTRIQAAESFLEQWQNSVGTTNEVLDEITIAITEAGATVERFQPAEGDSYATLATTTVELEVSGTTSELLSMLGALEAMPHSVWISHFSLTPKAATSTKETSESPTSPTDGEKVVAELRLIIFTGRADNSADVSFSSNR